MGGSLLLFMTYTVLLFFFFLVPHFLINKVLLFFYIYKSYTICSALLSLLLSTTLYPFPGCGGGGVVAVIMCYVVLCVRAVVCAFDE